MHRVRPDLVLQMSDFAESEEGIPQDLHDMLDSIEERARLGNTGLRSPEVVALAMELYATRMELAKLYEHVGKPQESAETDPWRRVERGTPVKFVEDDAKDGKESTGVFNGLGRGRYAKERIYVMRDSDGQQVCVWKKSASLIEENAA